VLIDCLTLLVSNLLLSAGEPLPPDGAEREVAAEIDSLLAACRSLPGTVIIVSSEVGSGLVPDSPLGRLYRDLLGRTNQAVAAQSAAVYLLVAGLPVNVKQLAASVEQAGRPFI
jgi:adenosylcobinamide kinase/adenosylcobinamide-phosphate guanylyltransferase